MGSAKSHCALLRHGSLLRIDALEGSAVACARGMVWLTQEHDPVDRILAAGESFVFDRSGIALLNALAHDAVLDYPHAERCTISRSSAGSDSSALSLVQEIGRIRARIDPRALAAMPAGVRREVVEREARRMQHQVHWLFYHHARRALGEAINRLSTRSRDVVLRARAALRGRLRRLNAN